MRIPVKVRPDISRHLAGNHDISIKKLEISGETKINIPNVAPPEDADSTVCGQRFIMHTPVQADEIKCIAQLFEPTKNKWIKKAHLEIRSEEHTSELQSRGHLVCRRL